MLIIVILCQTTLRTSTCDRIIILNYFRSGYDDEDYIPELDQEWFSEEELQQQKLVD